MITAIKEIGEYVQEKDFLKSLVKVNDNIKYIVKVNFDTNKNEITIEKEESDKEKLIRYLWIGHFVSGSHSRKIYFVTSDFKKIKAIITDFVDSDYAKEFPKLKEKVEKISSNLFSQIDNISTGIEKNEGAIYTISIDDELLSDDDAYRKIIEKELVKKHFLKKFEGFCSICGKTSDRLISEVYVFKFYNTDKRGFSSYLDGKFRSNILICEDCYKKSLTGKNFIEQNFNIIWGNDKFFIIPKLVFKPKEFNIKEFAKLIEVRYNPASEDISKFTKEMKSFIEFGEDNKNYFILNYLFYEQKNKSNPDSIAIVKLIKDVLPSRFDEINHNINAINGIVKKYGIKFSFKSFYYLIEQGSKNSNERKYFLELIEAILKEYKINQKQLIKKFVYTAAKIHYGTSNIKTNLRTYMLRTIYFLLFLHKINNLKENKKMEGKLYDEIIRLLKEKGKLLDDSTKDKKEYLNKYDKLVGYFDELKDVIDNDKKIGLIIMGYLLSEIASAQKSKNIPILNKINFSGMNYKDIIKLSNAIDEKLHQYKIYYFNDLLHYLKNKILLINSNNWEFTPYENVFYILSGFSLGMVFLKTEEEAQEDAADEANHYSNNKEG